MQHIPALPAWHSLPQNLFFDLSNDKPCFLTLKESIEAMQVCKSWYEGIGQNKVIINALALNVLSRYRSDACLAKDGLKGKFTVSILELIGLYVIADPQGEDDTQPTIAFGRQEWINNGLGNPGVLRSLKLLPSNIHNLLSSSSPHWSDQPGQKVQILFLMPHSVTKIIEGFPVTFPTTPLMLNNLIILFRVSSSEAGFAFVLPESYKGNEPQGCGVLCDSIIKALEQTNKEVTNQLHLIKKPSAEVPIFLRTAIAIVLVSKECLFSDHPLPFSDWMQSADRFVPITREAFYNSHVYDGLNLRIVDHALCFYAGSKTISITTTQNFENKQ